MPADSSVERDMLATVQRRARRFARTTCFFFSLAMMGAPMARAQSLADELKSAVMKGARNVEPSVIAPVLSSSQREELQLMLEVALRKNGLPVVRGIEPRETLYLFLVVDGTDETVGQLNGFAQLRSLQMVETLTPARQQTLATTWNAFPLFLSGSFLKQREALVQYIDTSALKFANDFLRANPHR